MVVLRGAFPDGDQVDIEKPLELSIAGVFTLRSEKPTTSFEFLTFDSQGYLIDTHESAFLPSMNAVLTISDVRIVQDDFEVGSISIYDIMVKSPYILYDYDQVFIEIPEQASQTLASSYEACLGSPLQSYVSASLNCRLQGLYGILIDINLNEDKKSTGIPAGEEFGFQL